MACYLFQNGSIFLKDHAGVSCLGWDEFLGSSIRKDRDVHVLMIESDGPGFFDQVRKIRRAFEPGVIKTFVPYGLALRCFLEKEKFISLGESVMVVDQCADRVFLTILIPGAVVLTRVIQDGGASKIMDELQRTQRQVIEKDGHAYRGQPLRLLSSYPDLPGASFFERDLAVFGVMGKVKFPTGLVPPEELARIRRMDLLKGLLRAASLAFLMAGAGAAFWFYGARQEQSSREHLQRSMDEEIFQKKELYRLGALTYRERLRREQRIVFADAAHALMRHVSSHARIDSFVFERGVDGSWDFSGLVFSSRQEIVSLWQDDVFPAAFIEDVFIQGRPGKRVRMSLGRDVR